MLEQAQPELGSQHPSHGAIDVLDRQQPTFERRRHPGWELHRRRQLDVEPGTQGHRGRRGSVLGDPRELVQERDRAVVGDHEAVEAPRVAQGFGEQPVRRRGLLAVDFLVAVHHRASGPGLHRHLERQQEDVAHLTATDVRRGKVPARLTERVAGEVLQRRDDPRLRVVTLKSAHVRGDHRADQVRILADRLLDAAPPRVPRHIGHRRQALMRTDAHASGGGSPPPTRSINSGSHVAP